jgi:hypothetical protein
MSDTAVSSATNLAASVGIQRTAQDQQQVYADKLLPTPPHPTRSPDKAVFSEEALDKLAAEEAKRAAAPGQNTTC